MQEYLGLKVVHAEPEERHAYDDDQPTTVPGYRVVYDQGTPAEYVSWSPADKFEQSYVAVETGTGMALKAVASLAILGAMQGEELDPANDQPSNAELGIVSDDTLRGIARLTHNTVREFLAYEGMLHHPPFDLCNTGVQQAEMNRVSAIIAGREYHVNREVKAEILKDRFRHVIVKSILA